MTTQPREDADHDSAEQLARLPVEPEMPESVLDKTAEDGDGALPGSAPDAGPSRLPPG